MVFDSLQFKKIIWAPQKKVRKKPAANAMVIPWTGFSAYWSRKRQIGETRIYQSHRHTADTNSRIKFSPTIESIKSDMNSTG